MLAIFLKTLPFFALIGTGYVAGRTRFFSAEATAYLTRFVFYFALSAMLFGFAANLDVAAIFDWPFVFAYTLGTGLVWLLVAAVALGRGTSREEAVFEAHTGVIGNVGFLGIPMLALLLVVIYPTFIWLTALTSKKWQVWEHRKNEHYDIAGGRFAEVVGQMRVVKSLVTERSELGAFGAHFDDAVGLTAQHSQHLGVQQRHIAAHDAGR